MKKKHLKLKKKAWFILSLIIFIPIAIISFIKIKQDYEYKKTYEYRFLEQDYTKEEYNLLAKYFDDNKLEDLLNKDKDTLLLDFLKNDKFIIDNLDRYLNFYNKYRVGVDEVILNVNLNLDYDWYDEISEVDTSKDILMLVNKYNILPEDYEPDDLVSISVKYAWGSGNTIRKEAYEAFVKMWDDAYDKGIYLIINLGYRSYQEQEAVYNRLLNARNRKYADSISARPGHSEHQTGLALDIFEKSNSNTETFKDSEAYAWLKDNAYKYGFILRYTKENEGITGFNAEDWHYRYVGIKAAKEITEQNLTFEEYYFYNVK